jgi:hypothetical protein
MSDTSGHFNPQQANFQPADYPPTEDERTFAMLAHVLQFFAGFIPPLVIYLVKRNSRFVAFHALQALLWQITYFVIIMLGMMTMFASMFGVIARQAHNGPANGVPPVGFFVGFGAFWLLFIAGWVVNLFLAIYYGIKSYHGEWAAYPLLGRWARRLVNA